MAASLEGSDASTTPASSSLRSSTGRFSAVAGEKTGGASDSRLARIGPLGRAGSGVAIETRTWRWARAWVGAPRRASGRRAFAAKARRAPQRRPFARQNAVRRRPGSPAPAAWRLRRTGRRRGTARPRWRGSGPGNAPICDVSKSTPPMSLSESRKANRETPQHARHDPGGTVDKIQHFHLARRLPCFKSIPCRSTSGNVRFSTGIAFMSQYLTESLSSCGSGG